MKNRIGQITGRTSDFSQSRMPDMVVRPAASNQETMDEMALTCHGNR